MIKAVVKHLVSQIISALLPESMQRLPIPNHSSVTPRRLFHLPMLLPGPGTFSYFWDFGDGTTSTLPDPIHTYLTNGNFIPILVATSSAGCIDTVSGSAPIPIGGIATDFTGPDSVCVNAVAAFTNTSLPAPASAIWTFGDGGTATQIDATHIYTIPGTYTVKLNNTNPLCTDSTSKTIVVVPGPLADFQSPDTIKCQPPLTVNFQDLSTGAISWQWNFGDGNTSTLQNPVHNYPSYGNDTVTLVVTNAFGCTDTIVKPGYVKIKKAFITIPGLPANGCIPYTLSPVPNIVSVDAVTSYQWDFGDGGTSAVANPTHVYPIQGTYTVRLIITTSTGCTDTLLINNAVKVGSKSTADFSAAPIPVCTHQPVQFTDLSFPVVDQWQWDFGDGFSSPAQNPVHMYADTGHFSVTLISFNNGCPDTLTKTNYTYSLPPIAKFTSAVTNCANRLQFSFTDQSILNPFVAPITWSWNFGDGSPVSATQNPIHTFPALGPYIVTLVVTNGGCSDMVKNTIQAIDQAPDITASATTICRGTSIIITPLNFNPGLTASLFWDLGNGATSNYKGAIAYTYANSGTYTISLVATDINGCTDTMIKNNYIRVNGPKANYTATNLAGCTGLVTTFTDLSTTDGINALVNWQWDFGDGTIQNFSGPPYQHTYNTVGTFSVILKVTDAAGCSDSIKINNLVTATHPAPNFISADTLTCPGATVTFTNTSVAVGFGSQWDFGDGNTSAITSPTHSYVATGFYDIKLQVQDINGCIDSITKIFISAWINRSPVLPSMIR